MVSKITGFLVEGFHCGCGCEWEVEYERNKQGYWEKYVRIITAEPKNKKWGHIHCPANAYDCPYWKDGVCSMYSKEEGWTDPIDQCDEFAYYWCKGDDYIDMED